MKRFATPIIAGCALAGVALSTAAPAEAQGIFRDDDRPYFGYGRGYDRGERYGREAYERGYRMGREDERRHRRYGFRRGFDREEGLFGPEYEYDD